MERDGERGREGERAERERERERERDRDRESLFIIQLYNILEVVNIIYINSCCCNVSMSMGSSTRSVTISSFCDFVKQCAAEDNISVITMTKTTVCLPL